MKKGEKKKGFSISLLPTEYEALTAFAESKGDSFSAWARKVLKRELPKQEANNKSKKSAPPEQPAPKKSTFHAVRSLKIPPVNAD